MRREYIEQQKRTHHRPVVAALPIHYPKVLLTAMNVLAVEIWGPPGPPRGAAVGRVQPYVCAPVRNALAFLASGGAAKVDGVLFPHTCDSIQGLATVAPDVGGWDGATLRYQHPKGEKDAASLLFVKDELNRLAHQLEPLGAQPLTEERTAWALQLHRQINTLRRSILANRARMPLSDPDLYTVLRRGEFLWPEDHLHELERLERSMTATPAQHGLPVMVTGYVPEPTQLLSVLDGAGVYLAADDYAAVGRRVVRTDACWEQPSLNGLAELEFAGPPCPTRGTDLERRLQYLERLFRDSGATGLLIHVVKFCEPELFDVPAIRRRFGDRRVPVLILESELEDAVSQQSVTRVEAFAEMLSTGSAVT